MTRSSVFGRAALAAVALLLLTATWGSAAPSRELPAITSRPVAGAEDIAPIVRGMVGGAPRYVEGEIIVRLRPEFAVAGVTTRDAAAGFEAATAALGARVVDSQRFATGGEMFRLQLPVGVEVDQAVQAYKSSRFVEYAEPNYLWFPDALPSELRFDRQWGMHNVGQDFSSIPSGEAPSGRGASSMPTSTRLRPGTSRQMPLA